MRQALFVGGLRLRGDRRPPAAARALINVSDRIIAVRSPFFALSSLGLDDGGGGCGGCGGARVLSASLGVAWRRLAPLGGADGEADGGWMRAFSRKLA